MTTKTPESVGINCPLNVLTSVGYSPRMAHYLRAGGRRVSPDKAIEIEKASGISRFHLLYPEEYDAAGNRLPDAPDGQDQ